MKSPILALGGCFALGIVLAGVAQGGLPFYLPACAVCLLAGLISLQRRWQAAASVFVLAGWVFAGASATRLFQVRFPANHISHLSQWGFDLSRPVRVQGTLVTSPLPMPYGLQVDVNVSQISSARKTHVATGKLRLRILNAWHPALPAASLHLRYGDTIRAWVRLQRPHNYQNPGSFNYCHWLESIHDIYWQGTLRDPASVQKSAGARPPHLRRLAEGVRQELLRSIDQLYPAWSVEGRDGAVLKAVLLGDRSSLDSDTIEDFRKSGLYHLLVVAGLHVGLLAMLAEGLLGALRLRESWRSLLLLLFLALYASVVEQRAPTLRATLMIAAYLVARLVDREQPALNAIGLAGLVLLMSRPAWLFDSGFQLSFAAALLIAGLAVPILARVTEPYRRALGHIQDTGFDPSFAPRLVQFRLDVRGFAGWLRRRWSWLDERPALAIQAVAEPVRVSIWIADLLLFSAILQLGLLLPMAETFHRVTLAGIGLNALAIPLMTVLLATALPVVILNTVLPAFMALPAKLLALIMAGLFGVTELPQLPHWLSFRVPTPPAWVACGFALSIVAAACVFALNRRAFAAFLGGAALCGFLIALDPFSPRLPRELFEVTDLDCGGGEALFIVLPDGATMLVGSCGGGHRRLGGEDPFRAPRWDPGENIVSPYLWSRGVENIDIFFLPGLGGDSLSGAASVLRNFRVKEFWYGALPRQPFMASVFDLLHQRGVRARALAAGGVIMRHNTTFQVLSAAAPAGVDQDGSQSQPVLMRIANRDGSLLLAGDLGAKVEEGVLKSASLMESQVLQMPRHEAQSDFLLIRRVRPGIALVALSRTGKPDCYSAPSPILRNPSPRVFCVAPDGAVSVDMKGGALSVSCYGSGPQ